MNIMFLDITHSPVHISKYNVSETGFSLRLEVKPIQLGSIGRAILYPEIRKVFQIKTG
jgi:hypothetical protein